MSIRPIDIKTNLMGNDVASRLRENQKAHEGGLADHVAQNKDAQDDKAESVQKTEAAEGKVIRKEDEEEEKKKKEKQQAKEVAEAKKAAEAEEEAEKKHPKLPDGVRGYKIDLKI